MIDGPARVPLELVPREDHVNGTPIRISKKSIQEVTSSCAGVTDEKKGTVKGHLI